ncbi:PAS domain-containing sensor histidine kinase [Piscinibacter sp. XHJ-5]|uniref:sensor histidine kinase n=1 Tax=Piscinibacter sp. XHJ-5 TaxID=3037797 RepID=UPI0024531AD5|nr:PAS domain-containing sensor histidine kinase [Piscinibacter sp. XHJ-5]
MLSVRSDRTTLLGVIGPLVLAILLLLALCIGGFSMLSAVRAYVGGESLWSKARAAAVVHLRAHALNGQAADYRRFVEALAVPLGDRQARLELDRPHPDLGIVHAGFVAGENAPDDIPGLIRLYRYFRHVEFMEEAVSTWAEGDRLIEQLQQLGVRIHAHVERGDAPTAFAPLLTDLDALDSRLASLERYFSATLGRASRKTERLLVTVTLALAALLALGGVLLVRRSMHHQLVDGQLLREANHRWDLAAGAAGVGLFDWHVADDRFELDPRGAALCGLGSGSATLKRADLRGILHPDDLASVRQGLDRAAAEGGLFKSRWRVVLPDGELCHLEAIGRMRDAQSQDRTRMVGVLRDVSAEIAQAQLALDKEAAERATRLRIEFLSRLSHELRTPLNAVLGVAQLLAIDPSEPLTANQSKRVRILLDSGEQLLRLVENVLDISRVDSGSLELQVEPTDLVAIARTSLDIVEPERASFGIRMEDRLPRRPAMVQADPQRLQQVLVNLFSNGCKFNTRGGRLTIACREDERHVWLMVSDEGKGLTREQQSNLFQPFKRLGAPAEVPGTGLGLVVAKLLVDQMHGSMSVESESGRGSTFSVRLLRA